MKHSIIISYKVTYKPFLSSKPLCVLDTFTGDCNESTTPCGWNRKLHWFGPNTIDQIFIKESHTQQQLSSFIVLSTFMA